MIDSSLHGVLSLAVQRHQGGRLADAAALYRRVLAVDPANGDALHLLGVAERRLGADAALALATALGWLARARAVAPGLRGLQENLGNMLSDAHAAGLAAHQSGRLDAAAALYRRVLAFQPERADILHLSGMAEFQAGRSAAAIALIEQAIARDGGTALYHSNLAHVLKAEGDLDGATAALERALALQPDSVEIRLRLAMTQLPSTYETAEDVTTRRAAYAKWLGALHDFCRDAPPAVQAAGADAVAVMQPYLLPYQAMDDHELQRLYGETVCRLMAARYPQWAQPLSRPPRDPDGRIRVGMVSAHFFGHSVWKIPIKGWIEHLPRDRFRLFGYSMSSRRDACTDDARRLFEHYAETPRSLEDWAKTIRADDLHVLLYPEIGMDPLTARLSCLRLAPVQAVSLGHPETTGQPTIDHYLSSDLMEPADAAAHYTEKLVRLPNLAVCYEPLAIPDVPVSRAELGLRDGATLYWCCQFLPKYLPQYDQVFSRIARGVLDGGGDCQFVFISNMSSGYRQRFEVRLARVFAACGLDWRRHCVVLGWLGATQFTGAIRLMDVFLDSIGWSGNNTTMESLHGPLPVVTFPQASMRGRHAHGVLRMLGVEDTVADNLDSYVDIAVGLGLDPARRGAVTERMRQARGRAYGDRACIDGLAAYLETAATA